MTRKTIKSLFDRNNLLNMNENFLELYNVVGNIDENIKNIATDTIQNVLGLNTKGNLFLVYKNNTTLSNANGTENSNDTTVASDYITVSDNQYYTIGLKKIVDSGSSLAKVAYYNKDKEFISITDWIDLSNDNNKVLMSPTSTRYVKIVINNESRDQLFFNVGSKPYYDENNNNNTELSTFLNDIILDYIKNTNLFNSYKENTTISGNNGNEGENDTTVASKDFIYVDNSREYIIGLKKVVDRIKGSARVFYYDENQSFISADEWLNLAENNKQIITLPENTSYIKIVVNTEHKDELFFNLGTTPYYELSGNETSHSNSSLEPELSSFLREMVLNYTKNTNLFSSYKENTTISSNSGNEANNDTTVSSKEFIYVDNSKEYIIGLKKVVDITKGLTRVFYYDENHAFISATEWLNLAENNKQIITLPENTSYIKIVVNTEHKDELFFNLGTTPYYNVSDDKTSSPKQTEVDNTINLVTEIVSNTTLSSTTGSENPSSDYSSVDFIEINPSKTYTYGYSNLDSVTSATTRIVLYDDSKTLIKRLDWEDIYDKNNVNITLPTDTSYVRFIIPNNLTDYFYFNEGEIPYFMVEEEENKKIVNKVIESLDLGKLKEEKKPLKPYPKKLMWEVLEENTNIKPLTMNREGTVIYASDGARVTQSTDDGETWTYVGGVINEEMIQGVRVLDDGELIVTTSRDKNNSIKSKLFKSSNYSVENPENTTYTEKLEMHNLDAAFNNAWCLDNYYNIVLASDYGGHYLTGARYVYLSTDYGETWETIFDQKEVSETVEGAPLYTTDAHVHTCHYDRYRERIWVCVGDQDNTATYYSDDMGKTWEIIKGYTGKDTMQYTGITSYPEGVFFGSDRAPDGVYFWDEDKPDEINPYYLTERSDIRTIVYALPFRRFAEKDEVCYFVGNRDGVVDGTMGPVIVGFKGVHGAQLLYDFTDDIGTFKYTNISACVGNTVNNNVLVSVKDDNTKDYRLLIAKAPVWE